MHYGIVVDLDQSCPVQADSGVSGSPIEKIIADYSSQVLVGLSCRITEIKAQVVLNEAIFFIFILSFYRIFYLICGILHY